MNFESLNISTPILLALQQKGYLIPTPIQEQAIPLILEGKDILGCAQTGTGKTAAFAIPIIQLLSLTPPRKEKRLIRSLIVTPTRELAIQIGESFTDYGKQNQLRHTVIFGGVNQNPQIAQLKMGVDVLIATQVACLT